MNEHKIKILPEYFELVLNGQKNFEIRKFDRDYTVSDTVVMQEWDGEQYTGRELAMVITSFFDDNFPGVERGYCVFGTERIFIYGS